RPAGVGNAKPSTENDYSRPRLNHRAPLVVSSASSGRGGGAGGSGAAAATTPAPVRRSKRKVESTHATPRPEEKAAELDVQPQATGNARDGAHSQDGRQGGGNGIVGAAAGIGSGGAGGKDEKSGVVKVQHRRRRSTGLDGGRKAAQQRGPGYPMTAVAAVLRQLHMRVLSGDEMKMLDQVTGEGVAEHLVEMRTILEDQKRRLETKIRSLHDVCPDTAGNARAQPPPLPNGVVVFDQGSPASRPTPPAPSQLTAV
ncbi:unnamed protein product, partial [Scytosiphon promiscuus]